MDTVALATAYFDAWNARDAAAIVATFAELGTYSDPTTNGPLTGGAIGTYASGLWQAFPDLEFEVRSTAQTASDKVVAEWTMAPLFGANRRSQSATSNSTAHARFQPIGFLLKTFSPSALLP